MITAPLAAFWGLTAQLSHLSGADYGRSALLGIWPLFEHLLDGFSYDLLVLVTVVTQCILAYTAPDKCLLLRVIDADDQCSLDILLGSNSAHAAADAPHAPGAVGSLLSQ